MDETSTEAEIEKLAKEVRAEMDEADARILEGDAGALIVKLIEPIKVGDDTLNRITVGRVKVRHVREARTANGDLEAYAEQLVSPAEGFDELSCHLDFITVIRATERQLGKYQEGGRPS